MYKYIAIFIVVLLGCAPAVAPREPELAQRISQEPPPVASGTIDREESAGAYLERGFLMFSMNRWREAVDAYVSAINTGNLNDAGRALAYWYISQCWIALRDEDQAMESLSSFVMVADDVFAVREQRRYAVTPDGDFVDQFDLLHKQAWARATLNYVWATRSNSYGRSKENPIIAKNVEELEAFAEIVRNSCSGECDFQRAPLQDVTPRTEVITAERKGDKQSFVIVVP